VPVVDRQGQGKGPDGKRRDVHERALGLLAVRQRSRRELERRLVQAGFGRDEVTSELDRLERVGLIDDEAFARAVVDARTRGAGESRRAIAGRLAAAGVDRETATQVLLAAGDEQERADALARARVAKLRGLEPPVVFRRVYGALGRKGYPPDVALTAARRALEVPAEMD
jgi:regulatory protein